jgi:hypothetical protein
MAARKSSVRCRADRESLKETRLIQADPELMREIRRGLRELKKGGGRTYTLEQLFPKRRKGAR